MLIFAKEYFIFMVIICASKIHTSSARKFSFRDTFVTPEKCDEDHSKEYSKCDKCEILERCNFGSSKESNESNSDSSEECKKNSTQQLSCKHNDTKACSSNSNEESVEVGSSSSKRNLCHHCSGYIPPYMIPMPFYGLPYYYNPNFMYPPPHWLHPYYPPDTCKNLKNGEKSNGFNQNIFQIVKLRDADKKCSRKSHCGSKCPKNVPVIKFCKNGMNGNCTSSEETVSPITAEDLQLVEEYLGKSSGESSESEEDDTEPKCPGKSKTRTCSGRKPCGKCSKCTTQRTTKCSSNRNKKGTNNTRKCQNTSTTKIPLTCTTSADSSQAKTTPTTECTSTVQPTNRKCQNTADVIINNVVRLRPCKEEPKNDSCSNVCGNIKFIKVDLCNSDDNSEGEGGAKCSTCTSRAGNDMGDLYGMKQCPVDASKYPNVSPPYPWGNPKNGPSLPPYRNPCHCEERLHRSLRSVPSALFGPEYFGPLNWFAPWMYYGQNEDQCHGSSRKKHCCSSKD